jgi:hypothetical protein
MLHQRCSASPWCGAGLGPSNPALKVAGWRSKWRSKQSKECSDICDGFNYKHRNDELGDGLLLRYKHRISTVMMNLQAKRGRP